MTRLVPARSASRADSEGCPFRRPAAFDESAVLRVDDLPAPEAGIAQQVNFHRESLAVVDVHAELTLREPLDLSL